LWLKPNEPVELQIEIWPTSIVLGKGHKLRVDIQPRDGVGSAPYTHYHADYNAGAVNTIYSGGDRLSYLLLPVIPVKK
jgi:predicted acyl esterase